MGLNQSRNTLNDQDRELANLADIAYDDKAELRHERAQKLGYSLDSELSNEHAAVFKHNHSGDAVIAYRGTKSPNDLSADWDIALGGVPENRVGTAMEVHQKTKLKYKKVKLTGHSLGGTIAHHVSNRTNDNATIFNPGSSPFLPANVGNNVRVIRNSNDMVSHGYRNSKNTINVQRRVDPIEIIIPWSQGYLDHQATQFYK
jgi:hypothetical protein